MTPSAWRTLALFNLLVATAGCVSGGNPSDPPHGDIEPLAADSVQVGDPSDYETDVSDVVRQRIERVAAIRARLPAGAIAFNAPDVLALAERVIVHLVVSPTPDTAAAADSLAAVLNPDRDDVVRSRLVGVAPTMRADLYPSTGLDVEPMGPAERLLHADGTTEWAWRVTASDGGRQALRLVLFAVLEDGEAPMEVRTFQEDIEVRVSPMTRLWAGFKENYDWALTLLILPGIELFRRLRNRRRGGPPPPASAPAAKEADS